MLPMISIACEGAIAPPQEPPPIDSPPAQVDPKEMDNSCETSSGASEPEQSEQSPAFSRARASHQASPTLASQFPVASPERATPGPAFARGSIDSTQATDLQGTVGVRTPLRITSSPGAQAAAAPATSAESDDQAKTAMGEVALTEVPSTENTNDDITTSPPLSTRTTINPEFSPSEISRSAASSSGAFSDINRQVSTPVTSPSLADTADTSLPPTAPTEQNPASEETPPAEDAESADPSPADAPATNPADSPEPENETDQLFEDVFGTPRNRGPQQVIVPLFINDQQRGQIFLQLPGGNQADILVDGSDLLTATEALVRPDIQAQLSVAVNGAGQINLRDIRQVGLEVTFDDRRLELQIQIPAALRATNILDVDDRDLPPGYETALRPSHTSAYVNVRGGQTMVWTGNADETGREPLLLNFDGALNVAGWVLEGQIDFTEDGSPAWRRGNLSLVHDDISQAIRYRLGDLSLPTRGYQSSIPMGGITVARNFSLQPFRVTRPISRFEFFLERPATIEAFVNGRLVQTLRLDAGPQDVRNLPLNAGINDVQLVITDDVGQVQRLDFATGVSGGLLAPGVQQFAYSLGMPSEQVGVSRRYDASKSVLTLSHRVGATDKLTLGGYFQGDLEQQLLGLEGTWATAIGNWTWDAAASRHNTFGWDVAMRVFYDLLRRGASSTDQRTLRLGLEYRGGDFITIGTETPSNPNRLDMTAAYSQLILGDVRATLSGQYQLNRDDASDAYDIRLVLAKPLGRGLNLTLNGSYGMDRNGDRIQQVNIGLTASLPRQRQTITSTTTLDQAGVPTSRLNWNYSSPRSLDGISTSLGTVLNASDIGITSQTRYSGYRASLTLDNTVAMPRGVANRPLETTSRLTWGTAFVMADGIIGWSRPIDNSFAIVTRQGTADDQLIRVNPSVTGEQGRADGIGPAVVPIQPYSLTTLSLDAPDLPVGYDLGESSYTLLPSYRSGTVITAGTEATVFIRGVLVGANGNPVSLQRGVIESLSDPDWPDVELFTNRVGRFALFGFKPGRYAVRVFGLEGGVTEFVIPEQASGLHQVGTLKLPVAVDDLEDS
ncbi:Outer membrane usher protein YehB [Halomicronema hongdechloris C2206]|uniref:Outer membrane usher protein YehB n=1 Tax=Halomicronema hongdechloris C2206 TaxID=1641165 RepID=A0A1Z3HM18_9CYAN|nr:fimbria/pilus outer membrane usher protein [Halomicronema hongdechloris]ASC71338.1 Outer membrane usher protein YehB [Halomicronema hongdechloris C2206]